MWSCPYLTHYNTTAVNHSVYIQLPANISLLNEFMCGPLDIQDIKGKTDDEAEHDTGSLPDQLITPDEYEPVVLTTEEHRAAEPTDSNQWSKKADSCVHLWIF